MLHTLTARLGHPQAGVFYANCYCYDEPSIDLYGEPLVHMTTEAIQHFLGDKPQEITLMFTVNSKELPKSEVILQLDYTERDPDGTTYIASDKQNNIPVWLCNHLFDYFSEPPQTFYVGINPTEIQQ